MPFLCVPGWDIYVFSHETSETVENIWLTNYFWSGPKNLSFWPFLAFEGRLGGLKDPLEVRVQHETYRSMSGTYVQAILSRKNWTGLAGALRNGRNMNFALWVGHFGENPIFFHFWSKSLRNGPKWSKSGVWQFLTIWDHFWMIWTNWDQKQKKCFFCPK